MRAGDLNGKSSQKWKPSPFKSIDGEDAQKWLRRFSYVDSSQDPDALYNSLFYSVPGSTQGSSGSFYGTSNVYTGPEITIEFENGTKREYKNEASFSLDFDGVKDGKSFYEKFCSGELEQAPRLKKRAFELQKRSDSESSRPQFPEAVIELDDGSIAGYFLEDDEYSDTAILSIASFATDSDSADSDLQFSKVASEFLAASKKAGKKKLILDVTANGGGSLFLGFDLFMQVSGIDTMHGIFGSMSLIPIFNRFSPRKE